LTNTSPSPLMSGSINFQASLNPFEDFSNLLAALPCANEPARHSLKALRGGSNLGRLDDIVIFLAGWQGKTKPVITRPLVAIFAGNHGMALNHISPRALDETKRRVAQFSASNAVINKICTAHDLGLRIYDLALDYPTEDITKDAAMDIRGCAATMAFGMEAIAGGTDLLALGDVGFGNENMAYALVSALFGDSLDHWLGDETEIGEGNGIKREAVQTALDRHQKHFDDPFEILRCLGGREFAALVGAILAARMEKIPVILDGFVVCAAAAVLHKITPAALDHCLAGHLSKWPGHRRLLEILDKKPLLDLEINANEATGAALAAGLVKAATLC